MTPVTTRPLAVRIVTAVMAVLVAVAASLALASPANADTASDEARLYQLTNDSRAANGRAALAYDAAASNVARAWAVELARSGSLRHNPNLVAQVDAQVTSSWTSLGENVGYAGSLEQMQDAYMASTGHRNNILGNYNRVGVGSARSADNRIWTAIVFILGPAIAPPPAPVSFAPFASAAALVNQQYADFLGRSADPAALSSWGAALQSGQATPASFVTALIGSTEFAYLVRPVTRLYLAYFGRSPDAAGLAYWVGQLRAGAPLANVSNSFAGSSEFATRYGALDNRGFVERVYVNVLGRGSDLAGLTYWLGQLLNGLLNRGGVMTGFSESSEYRSKTATQVDVSAVYLGLLHRAPDAAGLAYWVGQLRAGVPLSTLVASIIGSAEYQARF